MAHSLGKVIWLCWILCWLLPFVKGQLLGQFGINKLDGRGDGNPFTPPGFGGPGGPGGPGGRFRGKGKGRFGKGFRGGKGFGDGNQDDGQSQDQQGDQSTAQGDEPPAASEAEAPPAAPSSAAPAVSSAVAVSVASEETAAAAPEVVSSVAAPIPTATTSGFVQPSSVADVFGDTSTPQPLAGIPNVAPSSSANVIVASSSAAFAQFSTTLVAAPSTVTTSMTIFVTPSPVAASSPPGVDSPAATDTASSSMDLAPLSTETGSTMSASQQAGMGIGITFGVLSVAGATGLYLWRRRRNRRLERDNLTNRSAGNGGGFGGFFRLRSRSDSKNDPEWSIESAEKVEIVRGGSAKSVRTGSRSDSFGSNSHPSSSGAGEKVGLEVLKVGMRVPDRKPNPALTSNPPVSPSEFPSPPSSRGSPSGERKEGKTSSWPLPD